MESFARSRGIAGWVLGAALWMVCGPVATAQVDVRTGLPGKWNWVSGQSLIVEPDGTCRVYSGTQQINSCRWVVVDAGRRHVRITHEKGGWVDTVSLSPDGNVLEGTNNTGATIRGSRAVAAAPLPVRALDLNGSWSGGLLHIWQDGAQVLVTATWKRADGKYACFRGDGQLNGNVVELAIRYSPMTHGPAAPWRGVLTVSPDGNALAAVYTQGPTADRQNYVRDR